MVGVIYSEIYVLYRNSTEEKYPGKYETT